MDWTQGRKPRVKPGYGQGAGLRLDFNAQPLSEDYLRFRKQDRTTRRLSESTIKTFTAEIGIAPGIVLGRLQHDAIAYLRPSKKGHPLPGGLVREHDGPKPEAGYSSCGSSPSASRCNSIYRSLAAFKLSLR